MTPITPTGSCDNCGNTDRLYPKDTPHGEGSFCAECLGFDPRDEDDEREDDEPDLWAEEMFSDPTNEPNSAAAYLATGHDGVMPF